MSLIDRVKNIITSPNKEWDVIAGEQPNTGAIITGYVLPLAGVAAVAAFIGYGVIGTSFLGIRIASTTWGIYYALNILVAAIAGVFISSAVIDALAPSFGSEKNMGRSVQLVAYSYTPAWIGGILSILPAIALIGALFGIYGLYLLFLGMPKLKKTPEDKSIGYYIVSLVVIIVVYFIIGLIMSRLIMPAMGLSYPLGGINVNM
ncbi:MAG TPA: Yip1 family protein [Chitinophagaceae bacterium]|nr:Yip1 family protein [Chitinophagaceae bacterium]